MSDQFQFWRDALDGKSPAIHEDAPQPGYYKLRRGKDAPWVPVAIWYRDGELVCRVGPDMRYPLEVWVSCADNPVAKDDAKHAFQHGTWPGDVPVAGHNSQALTLAEEIADAAEQALAWLKGLGHIASKTDSDKAANWRAKLLDLSKKADKERDEKKRPHLEAGRAIDAEYKPLVTTATDAANELRDALTAWMKAEEAKLRAEQEAKRKAAEEEASKQREAAGAARREAEAKNLPPPPEPEDVPLPMFDEPVKVQAGGQRGRKAGLRTITVYEVTDYVAALEHCKNHPDVIAAVEKVAKAQAKAGATVPGVVTREEKVAA
jgi:hypothetical protein